MLRKLLNGWYERLNAFATTIEMFYLNVALDNGVKPREISEIITHLSTLAGECDVGGCGR